MKCLRKYDWVKLPRSIPDMGKGRMGYWAKLASRAAFRKGNSKYCGHTNPVTPGMWAGGAVGLKSILGVRSRAAALDILEQLAALGYVKYSLDPVTKKLTYEITDWVIKCSGAECMDGAVYTTEGFGFLCLPRNITERLFAQKQTFEEADAWLDLWCHTTFEDRGNMVAWHSAKVIVARQGQSAHMEAEPRVAPFAPITRAYISHGWNCKNCRNCQYACRGTLTGPPVFREITDRIRGPCIHNRQDMRRFH